MPNNLKTKTTNNLARHAAYMQMIYIDSDRNARHTRVGAMMKTSAETRKAFKALRTLECPIEDATFLCDLHAANGDLVDTIALSRVSFTAITGERVLTDADYRRIDNEYWAEAEDKGNAA